MQIYGWGTLCGKSQPSHLLRPHALFLICRMASCEHLFKGLCEFMGKAPRVVSLTLLCLVVIGQAQVEVFYVM